MRRYLAALALSGLAALSAPPAHAWGDEGHQIVALIAEHYLAPAVDLKVHALLDTDRSALVSDTSMASEATWADRYRDSDRQTSRERYERTYRWHFVDLELGAPDLKSACFLYPRLLPGTSASAGVAQDCIVDKIEQFEAELAAPGTDPDERRVALQFLLHLVGDLHQPLHASTEHDQGGNLKHVSADSLQPANLHRYWDVEFVRALGDDPPQVASELIAHITAADRAAWSRGSVADWALESYAIAKAVAYEPLPAPDARGEYRLSAGYVNGAVAAVRMQLSRAGVRLAWLLNRALQAR